MISLNIADLMICISSLANLFCYNEYIMRAKNNETSSRAKEAWTSFGIDWQLYGMGPLMSLGLLTCFITLMLSSTRTLAVVVVVVVVIKNVTTLLQSPCLDRCKLSETRQA